MSSPRLLVYSARAPAERAAIDWNAVIARIDAGITTDFSPQAKVDVNGPPDVPGWCDTDALPVALSESERGHLGHMA